MFKIITIPNKKLRKFSEPVKKVDKKIINFIDELGETLIGGTSIPGVGLSAIQVGKPTRIFVTYLPKDKSLPSDKWNEKTLELKVFINPKIVAKSKKMTLGGRKDKPFLEGCLTIPNIWGPVLRHDWVRVEYTSLDDKNSPKKMVDKFSGFQARVVQHEHDHLEGILFTDHSIRDNLPVYEERGEELVEIKL
jgi:peptide deformylase